MAKIPTDYSFRFSKNGDPLVTIRVTGGGDWEVYYKDNLVDSFKLEKSKLKELKEGISYELGDGANFVLCFRKRFNNKYWEPYLDGKLAYETTMSQHKYIWVSWIIAAIVVPIAIFAEAMEFRGGMEFVAPYALAAFLINLTCAALAIACWKPIAWIVASLWVAEVTISWVFYAAYPVGLPPIVETVGIVIFRDFLVHAKFIWNVLDNLSKYKKEDKRESAEALKAGQFSGNPDFVGRLFVPNNRAISGVKIRSEPSSDSPVIGRVEAGKSAQFLSDVPFWYLIETPNGTKGYVSKSWGRIIVQ